MSLGRYGLKEHPFQGFEGRFEVELDYSKQRDLYADIYGFREHRQRINNWFTRNGKTDRPKFFVVEGPKGSGRNSVANYIVHCYEASLGTKGSNDGTWKLLTLPIEVESENDVEELRHWMIDLYKAIVDEKGIRLENEIKERLRELTRTQPQRLSGMDLEFWEVFRSVAESLYRQGWRIVALFDEVKSDKFYQFCEKVFDSWGPLVVYIRSWQTENGGRRRTPSGGTPTLDLNWPKGEDGMRITLGSLNGDDVIALLNHRWNILRAPGSPPFDEEPIKELFNKISHAVKAVNIKLGWLFDYKLNNLNPNGNWPDDKSLRIDGNDMFLCSLNYRDLFHGV